MSAIPSVQAHPASIDAYIRHGWSLVPIPGGTKGPRTSGWNLRANALKSQNDLPTGYGIGLAHAYSGTMALDIDNWDVASMVLGLQGIDIRSLYDANDAVIVDSGRAGHGKLIYRMPEGVTLPTKKIITSGETTYELRCATANELTVQDVLPPSIHPDTQQPYRWAGKGHWMRLPMIPDALLELWQGMLAQDKERTITTGDSVNASWGEIRSAIECIPADCSREEWVNVGMALHWAGTQSDQLDQALQLWNEWSATSPAKYPGEKAIWGQWVSFKSDKASAVKLGTLFHIAKQHDWQRPALDVSELFKNTAPPKLSPTDLIRGIRPKSPDIDVGLFPEVLASRAMQISTEMGSDPLTPLFAGLAAVCGVIDARIRLELMPRYKVPPVLWLMTIGSPALKKSPASKPMLTTLGSIEAEDRPRYKKDLLAWEGKEAAYNSAKKGFLEWSASTDALMGGDQAPNVPELDNRPAPLKITTSDVTSQKLVRAVADNPRGMLCYLDEMNGWIGKVTDRSSGDDRSAWVVSYEADRYEMDRVGTGLTCAENFAVSLYGNVQPDVFYSKVSALAEDGLLQRFIPVLLRDNDWGVGQPLPDFMINDQAWDTVLRLVYALPVTTFKLSPEAYEVYREFQHWYNAMKQDEVLLRSGSVFMTAFGKLEGTVGRLMLIWHVIEQPFSQQVSASVAERVIHFAKSYLIPAYRYAFDGAAGSTFDNWVIEYIIQYADKGTVTLSEIKRSARRQLDKVNTWMQDQWVMGAMQTMVEAGWLIRMDDGTREHQHIAEWAIDPRIMTMFTDYRESVMAAKQRRLDETYKLSTKERKFVKGYKP